MGKKRTITIGSEEEAVQKEEARKRREAKKAAKGDATESAITASEAKQSPDVAAESIQAEPAATGPVSDSADETVDAAAPHAKKTVKKSVTPSTGHRYSTRHAANLKKVTARKIYALADAINALSEMTFSKMDETVELHINTTDKITGSTTLPHGTGKSLRVAILAPAADPAAADELLKKIDAGIIEFDILIATPDAMPRLAKAAKVLGPKGLMPNPKNGTVTPHPKEAAEKFAGGQMNYKTEAKANILHVGVGKMSFGTDKLTENVKAFIAQLDNSKVRSIYLKSTMSPSLRIK